MIAQPQVLRVRQQECLCRKAAAARYGLDERSDQVWAYNKATAGTGGLAVVLPEEGGLSSSAADLLCLLPMPWHTDEFWTALQDLFWQTKKVQVLSNTTCQTMH